MEEGGAGHEGVGAGGAAFLRGRQVDAAVDFEPEFQISFVAPAVATSSASESASEPKTTIPLGSKLTALTAEEIRLIQAAQDAEGWFKINDIAAATGLGRDWINDVARGWAARGYLTAVLYEGKQRLGRKITDKLLEVAGR